MLRLGTIGTSWIVRQFIEAAMISQQYDLIRVYSRSLIRAQDLIAMVGVPNALAVDTLSELVAECDVIYVASPNSLHYQHVKAAIEADCHVIVEKPAFSNPSEYAAIKRLLADHPEVMLMEAARHIYQPNFAVLRQTVARLPKIQGANFTMAQYSSKFDAYLAGENPNVFNRDFSAGALYDLGVYPLYAAIALFGQPAQVQYLPILLANQADGSGQANLFYGGFNVTLNFSKTYNSSLPSEVYGLRETIQIDHIADLNQVTIDDGLDNIKRLSQNQADNPMLAEATTFAHWMQVPTEYWITYQEYFQLSQTINQVLYNLRQSAGIEFAADKRTDDN